MRTVESKLRKISCLQTWKKWNLVSPATCIFYLSAIGKTGFQCNCMLRNSYIVKSRFEDTAFR